MKTTTIAGAYKKLFKQLKSNPGQEKVLDDLIVLETKIKEELFFLLEEKYGNDWKSTNIYNNFQQGKEKRDQIESQLMKKTVGDAISINDLVDVCLQKLQDILYQDEDIQEKLHKLNITHIVLKQVILPPDKGLQIPHGSGSGIEKKETVDKFGLLIDKVFRSLGIFSDDIIVFTGEIRPEISRKDSYICIQIPKINKTLFINNQYGEATFVCDGIVAIDQFTSSSKKDLANTATKILFSQNHINDWIAKMIDILSTSQRVSNQDTSPIKGKKNLLSLYKAPEGRKTKGALSRLLSVDDDKTIKKTAEHYRASHPEWFAYFLDASNQAREFYHPELCTLIQSLVESTYTAAPSGRKTRNAIKQQLGIDYEFVAKTLAEYQKEYPYLVKEYMDQNHQKKLHCHPYLIQKIEEKLNEKGSYAPEGRLTNSALAAKTSQSGRKIKEIANSLLKENPQWGESYADMARQKRIHYHPDLCKMIEEILAKEVDSAPVGWYTASSLGLQLAAHPYTIQKLAKKYRDQNPDYFAVYKDKTYQEAEHYAPDLVAQIIDDLKILRQKKVINK